MGANVKIGPSVYAAKIFMKTKKDRGKRRCDRESPCALTIFSVHGKLDCRAVIFV